MSSAPSAAKYVLLSSQAEPFARACCRMERNGLSICARCNKLKAIRVRAQRLCNHCYKAERAPQMLRDYVQRFTTPFRYNRVLFEALAGTIDWQGVNQKVEQRFRAFGRFLQTYEFEEPLTWQAIEDALPALGPTNRNVSKRIRARCWISGMF